MEWQGPVSGPGRSYNRDRCFSKGLGSLLPRSEYGWPLVFGRKEITHQLPRASSGLLCYQNIHQNQRLCSCQTVAGQCISSCLYQQEGRYPFPKSFESCNNINLWEWCFQHQLLVSAQHLPGNLNMRADQESRAINDSSDWKLNPTVFQTLSKMLVPFQVDLFASRLTHQLPIFASWKPDPLAANIDAFSVDWGNIQGYTFPPFALIGRCLRQPPRLAKTDAKSPICDTHVQRIFRQKYPKYQSNMK